MNCGPPGSSVHGILEWAAISYCRWSSRPGDRTCVSCASCTGRQTLAPPKPSNGSTAGKSRNKRWRKWVRKATCSHAQVLALTPLCFVWGQMGSSSTYSERQLKRKGSLSLKYMCISRGGGFRSPSSIYSTAYRLFGVKKKKFKRQICRLSWWLSGRESTCQCRRHRFDLWYGKIIHATEQLSLCTTTTEPVP